MSYSSSRAATAWCARRWQIWDQLVLVVSIADPAPNAFVLDKLIAIAEYQKIEPVIVITKCDLADPKEFADIYRQSRLCRV